MLIFLIGVRGAGKSSCLDQLRGRPDLRVLVPSTTRPRRNANDTEYDFCTAFNQPMAWDIPVGQYRYGMRRSEVVNIEPYQVGVTVFEPSNLPVLLGFRSRYHDEVIIVGLDTIQTVAEQTLRVGGAAGRVQTQADIDAQRGLIADHSDLLLRGSLIENVAAIQSAIRVLRSRGGVLDKQSILNLASAGTLIKDFDANSAETASYDLRLGDQLLFDGGLVSFTHQQPSFSIPPYSFVIAESLERVDLPRFISGRFDLRVSHFMRGMILSNGPQVDPGFEGALFCMLYNASDQPVPVKRGEHFATIEFHTTALSTTGSRPTAYHAFQNLQHLAADILQRPGSKLLSRIDSVTPRATKVMSFWTAAFGILVAILTIFAGWALTTVTDAQNKVAEAKRQLDEAKESTQKLQALTVESQKSLNDLKARTDALDALLLKAKEEQSNAPPDSRTLATGKSRAR